MVTAERASTTSARLQRTLLARFTRLAADPATYERRVQVECAIFPEGDLFPFTLPAMGFASAVARGRMRPDEATRLSVPLLERAVRATVGAVDSPAGRLEALVDYRSHGVYLGQLAMALGFHRLATGDERFEPVRTHLVRLLHRALVASGGMPLDAFPGASWPFDTIPPVVALHLDDGIHRAGAHTKVIASHLRWVRDAGTDRATGLPWSHLGRHGGAPAPPRGCDLAWRIPLLALIDRAYALETYRRFCHSHWLERVVLAGFAEYPRGADLGSDADSGPILWGMGLAATGFGISAAEVAGDRWRSLRLLNQLPFANLGARLVAPHVRRHVTLDPGCVTGLLMGDVCLFGTLGLRLPAVVPA